MKRKELYIRSTIYERIRLTTEPARKVLSVCSCCGLTVRWMTVWELSRRLDISIGNIASAIEQGKFHISIRPNGTLLICERSTVDAPLRD